MYQRHQLDRSWQHHQTLTEEKAVHDITVVTEQLLLHPNLLQTRNPRLNSTRPRPIQHPPPSTAPRLGCSSTWSKIAKNGRLCRLQHFHHTLFLLRRCPKTDTSPSRNQTRNQRVPTTTIVALLVRQLQTSSTGVESSSVRSTLGRNRRRHRVVLGRPS